MTTLLKFAERPDVTHAFSLTALQLSRLFVCFADPYCPGSLYTLISTHEFRARESATAWTTRM
jgi:hypothetical protein